jgi:hypothetical protein
MGKTFLILKQEKSIDFRLAQCLGTHSLSSLFPFNLSEELCSQTRWFRSWHNSFPFPHPQFPLGQDVGEGVKMGGEDEYVENRST